MSNTLITARIYDQTLQIINRPLIASGSVNVLQIRCEFDSLWDGYGKTAVFYNTREKVFHVPVVDGTTTVPQEVLAEEGYFYFGIMGAASNTRTTEVVCLEIKQGAITIPADIPAEPTPDIYQQILAAYGQLEESVAVERARLNGLVEMRGASAAEHNLSDEYVNGIIRTNGVSAYIRFTISRMSLVAGGNHYTDYCILPALAPLGPVYLESSNPDINVTIEDTRSEGWARILIENVGNAMLTTDEVVFVEAYYPLASPYLAELGDIRIAYNGARYPTAGEAVRGQVLTAGKKSRTETFENGDTAALSDVSKLVLHGKSTAIPSKNLCSLGSITVTGNQRFEFEPIPAGRYAVSAIVESSDIDASVCVWNFKDADNNNMDSYQFARSANGERVTGKGWLGNFVDLERPCVAVQAYSASSGGDSAGDTATFTDIQIEAGETATDYEPYGSRTEGIEASVTMDDPNAQIVRKNVCSLGSVKFVGQEAFKIEPIPAGQYMMSAVVKSKDADDTTCAALFKDASDTTIGSVTLPRSTGNERVHPQWWVDLSGTAVAIRFFAASSGNAGTGDEAEFKDIQVEAGKTATDYEAYKTISDEAVVFSAEAELFDGDKLDFASGVLTRIDGSVESVETTGDVTLLNGGYAITAGGTVSITSSVPENTVLFTNQNLTAAQKAQARKNVGAAKVERDYADRVYPLFENIDVWEPVIVDDGYSTPTAGWGGITKRADWAAENKYTYYDFLAHYYDGYIGTTADGYRVTKTSLGQDCGKSGHEIFEYDFCPADYKYTVLLTAGMNADETQGIWGLATFMRCIMNREEPNLSIAKDNVRFRVIPIVNASGFDQDQLKYSYLDGVNPNKNFNYQDSWIRQTATDKGEYPDSNVATAILKKWLNGNSGRADLWVDLHTGRWDVDVSTNKTIMDVRVADASMTEAFTPYVSLIKQFYVGKGYVTASDSVGGVMVIRDNLDYQKSVYAFDVCQIPSIMSEMHLESTGYGADGYTNNTPAGIKAYVLQIRAMVMAYINAAAQA